MFSEYQINTKLKMFISNKNTLLFAYFSLLLILLYGILRMFNRGLLNMNGIDKYVL